MHKLNLKGDEEVDVGDTRLQIKMRCRETYLGQTNLKRRKGNFEIF